VARLLLDKGADVNKADKDGTTPLHIVCQNGNVALAPPPIPPRSPGGTVTLADGTVIHSSVAPALPPRDLPPVPSASGDLLGLLLDKGAEVNRADKHGQTPLAIAKQEGHSAVVALIEEHQKPLPLGRPRPQRQQSDVQCSICLGPYKERAWTKCNHSFCRKCITEVCRTNPPTNRAPCPFCRQPVLLGELTRRPSVADAIPHEPERRGGTNNITSLRRRERHARPARPRRPQRRARALRPARGLAAEDG
jgi:hypothetical protein